MIILEGPDGGGKTFTAKYLSSLLNLEIFHAGGPPQTKEEFHERCRLFIGLPENKIYDRCTLISEPVYGPIIRNTYTFRYAEILSYLVLFKKVNPLIIYCRPSLQTLVKVKLETKNHKDLELIKKVTKKQKVIISTYDGWISSLEAFGFGIIHFNRDFETLEELGKICVDSMSY